MSRYLNVLNDCETADFDGDRKADFSIFRPSSGTWYVLNSATSNMTSAQFGLSTDRIVPGDYDGDGKTDFAIFRNGTWYVLQSSNGFTSVQWGASGDTPVPAGYLSP